MNRTHAMQAGATVSAYRRTAAALALIGAAGLSGCTTVAGPSPGDDPAYGPVSEETAPNREERMGSIYSDSQPLSLFEDPRARHVGDILTVVLQERTDAEKSSSTSTDRSGSAGFSVPTADDIDAFSAESSSGFEGDGQTDQSNQLDGSITVTVAAVRPSGNLVIQGEKWITINHGREYIRLRGLVRPEDIATNNSLLSTKIANARISYSGRGALADNNRPGWLMRFFQSPIWPF